MFDPDGSINQCTIQKFFSTTNSGNMYGWFNLVMSELLPFSVVEKRAYRESVKFQPVSLSSFMRYLPRITEAVENKIAQELPDKISLILDGWTSYSTHYTPTFAAYPSSNTNGYATRLLTLSPLQDETSIGADEHIAFITYIISFVREGLVKYLCDYRR